MENKEQTLDSIKNTAYALTCINNTRPEIYNLFIKQNKSYLATLDKQPKQKIDISNQLV